MSNSENEIQEFIENFKKSGEQGCGDLIGDLCLQSGPDETLKSIIHDKIGESELNSGDEGSFDEFMENSNIESLLGLPEESDDSDDDYFNNVVKQDVQEQKKFGANTAKSHDSILMRMNPPVPLEVKNKVYDFDVDRYEEIVSKRVRKRFLKPREVIARKIVERKTVERKTIERKKREPPSKPKEETKKKPRGDEGRYIIQYFSDSD